MGLAWGQITIAVLDFEGIGNLINLQYLCLDNNLIEGSIPVEFSNLLNLTYLYLSNNKLSGTINESICNIDINWGSIATFRIGGNQICPPYPNCVLAFMGEQDITNCER
jgi:hypothetical protein